MAEARLDSYKLPRGRHGLSREHVAENQRWRLLGAATELLAEGGYRSLTSHKIAARAGVSSQAFYMHFGGLGDCLRAAFEAAAETLAESGQISGAVERLAQDLSIAVLFGIEARAAVPEIAAGFTRLAKSLAQELSARLFLGAVLTLASECPPGQDAASARCAAEVADLAKHFRALPREKIS